MLNLNKILKKVFFLEEKNVVNNVIQQEIVQEVVLENTIQNETYNMLHKNQSNSVGISYGYGKRR